MVLGWSRDVRAIRNYTLGRDRTWWKEKRCCHSVCPSGSRGERAEGREHLTGEEKKKQQKTYNKLVKDEK